MDVASSIVEAQTGSELVTNATGFLGATIGQIHLEQVNTDVKIRTTTKNIPPMVLFRGGTLNR